MLGFSSTKSSPKEDLRVTAVPSEGDVDLGLQSTMSDVDPPLPGSNASTMSTVSSLCTERDSNDSCEPGGGIDEHSLREYELVQSMLYSTRDNVNITLEVFRQVC